MNKLWEQINNPDFKPVEFDRFKHEAGAKNDMLNSENKNAELLKLGLSQNERTLRLNKMAIEQMTSLAKYRKQTRHIEDK